jgi:GDP-D-mannose dehydratase
MKGDFGLAKKELGWEPKVFMPELMAIMVDSDIAWLKSHNIK